MKTNAPKTEKKAQSEHLMEKFPAPQGMPAEWQEHDIATAKLKVAEQAKKAEKGAEVDVKFEKDPKKEKHMMEKFPGLNTEPENWHCAKSDE